MDRWKWLTARLTRRIWFRATLISLVSVVLALAASWLAPLVPYDISLKVGTDAADNILGILASSMLAVTTFSMASMVTAFGAAARNVTPRAAQLLIEDRTAQNALSTFLGGFLFGIVGIVALSTGFYGPEGRAVLFIGTVLMIGWIVITLLRWIEQLTSFGRMEDAIHRVEQAACEAVARHPGPILLTGRIEHHSREGWIALTGKTTGHVTHVASDITADGANAGVQVEIAAVPGQFVDARTPLAWVDRAVSTDCANDILEDFTIETDRRFEHDPRFGMVVLSEIASRALSPAVNDPGSAISILSAGQRVAERLLERAEETKTASQSVPVPLSLEELMEDLILPITRDGAAMAEVQIRLHQVLGSLAIAAPGAKSMLLRLAKEALRRSQDSEISGFDLDRVQRAHKRAFAG